MATLSLDELIPDAPTAGVNLPVRPAGSRLPSLLDQAFPDPVEQLPADRSLSMPTQGPTQPRGMSLLDQAFPDPPAMQQQASPSMPDLMPPAVGPQATPQEGALHDYLEGLRASDQALQGLLPHATRYLQSRDAATTITTPDGYNNVNQPQAFARLQKMDQQAHDNVQGWLQTGQAQRDPAGFQQVLQNAAEQRRNLVDFVHEAATKGKQQTFNLPKDTDEARNDDSFGLHDLNSDIMTSPKLPGMAFRERPQGFLETPQSMEANGRSEPLLIPRSPREVTWALRQSLKELTSRNAQQTAAMSDEHAQKYQADMEAKIEKMSPLELQQNLRAQFDAYKGRIAYMANAMLHNGGAFDVPPNEQSDMPETYAARLLAQKRLVDAAQEYVTRHHEGALASFIGSYAEAMGEDVRSLMQPQAEKDMSTALEIAKNSEHPYWRAAGGAVAGLNDPKNLAVMMATGGGTGISGMASKVLAFAAMQSLEQQIKGEQPTIGRNIAMNTAMFGGEMLGVPLGEALAAGRGAVAGSVARVGSKAAAGAIANVGAAALDAAVQGKPFTGPQAASAAIGGALPAVLDAPADIQRSAETPPTRSGGMARTWAEYVKSEMSRDTGETDQQKNQRLASELQQATDWHKSQVEQTARDATAAAEKPKPWPDVEVQPEPVNEPQHTEATAPVTEATPQAKQEAPAAAQPGPAPQAPRETPPAASATPANLRNGMSVAWGENRGKVIAYKPGEKTVRVVNVDTSKVNVVPTASLRELNAQTMGLKPGDPVTVPYMEGTFTYHSTQPDGRLVLLDHDSGRQMVTDPHRVIPQQTAQAGAVSPQVDATAERNAPANQPTPKAATVPPIQRPDEIRNPTSVSSGSKIAAPQASQRAPAAAQAAAMIPSVTLSTQGETHEPRADANFTIRENQQPSSGTAFTRPRAGGVDGRQAVVRLADESARPITYRAIEADDLIPTHDARQNFAINPEGDVNERPYHHPVQGRESRQTVEKIAGEPDVSLLTTDTPSPLDGPPIVAPGGEVLGGNARSMAMQLAYSRGGAPAESLRKGIIDAAGKFGLDPEKVGAMKHPIIVRELAEPGTRGDLSSLLNEGMTTGKSAAVDAASRAARLSPGTASYISAVLSDDHSLRDVLGNDRLATEIVQRMVEDGVWSPREVSAFTDPATHRLTESGKGAIEDMLLARVVGDAGTVGSMAPSVRRNLAAAIAPITELSDKPETDLRPRLQAAVASYNAWKRSGMSLSDYFFDQASLMPPPGFGDMQTALLVRALDDMGPRQFAGAVTGYKNLVTPDAESLIPSTPLGTTQAMWQAFNGKEMTGPGVRREAKALGLPVKTEEPIADSLFPSRRGGSPAPVETAMAETSLPTPASPVVPLHSRESLEALPSAKVHLIAKGLDIPGGPKTQQIDAILAKQGKEPGTPVFSQLPSYTREQLQAMKWIELQGARKALGLPVMGHAALIDAILEKQGQMSSGDVAGSAMIHPQGDAHVRAADPAAEQRAETGAEGVHREGGPAFVSDLAQQRSQIESTLRSVEEGTRRRDPHFRHFQLVDPVAPHHFKLQEISRRMRGVELHFAIKVRDPGYHNDMNGMHVRPVKGLVFLNPNIPIDHALRALHEELFHEAVTAGDPLVNDALAALGDPSHAVLEFLTHDPAYAGESRTTQIEEVLAHAMGDFGLDIEPHFLNEQQREGLRNVFDKMFRRPEQFANPTDTADQSSLATPDPDAPFLSREHAPTFYSALERAVGTPKIPEKANAIAMLGAIKNTPGVKPDEMKWTGLDQFLQDKKNAPVTKQEVLDYLKHNAVEVREVVKKPISNKKLDAMLASAKENDLQQDRAFREALQATGMSKDAAAQMSEDLYLTHSLGTEHRESGAKIMQVSDVPEAAREAAQKFWDALTAKRDIENVIENSDPGVFYRDMALAGGKSYRELLLTLPEKSGLHVRGNVYDTSAMDEGERNFLHEHANDGGRGSDAVKFNELLGKAKLLGKGGQRFTSSHFDEPNILAHVRFQTFRGPDGEKLLHLDEIQSDWHQEGRDKGYRPEKEAKFASLVKRRDELMALGRVATSEQKQEWADTQNQIDAMAREDVGVPDAPFRKTWQELSLRRMVRWAAEHGFHAITWTPGATQAERYSLSKAVDHVVFDSNGKTGDLWGYKGGKAVVHELNIPVEKLADYIGKDAAKKLMDQPGKSVTPGSESQTRELSGDELSVGGKGMKVFYDQIVPDYLNKFGKKWNAQAGTVTLRADQQSKSTNDEGQPWDTLQVQQFPITPAMRQSVLEEGVALFSKDSRLDYYKALWRGLFDRLPMIEERTSPAVALGFVRAIQSRPLAAAMVRGIADRMFDGAPDKGITGATPQEEFIQLGYSLRGDEMESRTGSRGNLPALGANLTQQLLNEPYMQQAITVFNREFASVTRDIRTRNGMLMNPNAKGMPFFLNLPAEIDGIMRNGLRGADSNLPFNKAADGKGDYEENLPDALTRIMGGHLYADAVQQLNNAIRQDAAIPKPAVTAKRIGNTDVFVTKYGYKDEKIVAMNIAAKGQPDDIVYVPKFLANEYENLYRRFTHPENLYTVARDQTMRLVLAGDLGPHGMRILNLVNGRIAQSGQSLLSLAPSWMGSLERTLHRMTTTMRLDNPVGETMQLVLEQTGGAGNELFGTEETDRFHKIFGVGSRVLRDPVWGVDPTARRAVADAYLRMALGNGYVDAIEKQLEAGTLKPTEAAQQYAKALQAREGARGPLALARMVNGTLGYANPQLRSQFLNNAREFLTFLPTQAGMIPAELTKLVTRNINLKGVKTELSQKQYGRAIQTLATMILGGSIGTLLLMNLLNWATTKAETGKGRFLHENPEKYRGDIYMHSGWYWSNLDPAYSRPARILGEHGTPYAFDLPDVPREAVNEAMSSVQPMLRSLFTLSLGKATYVTEGGQLMTVPRLSGLPIPTGRNSFSAALKGRPIKPEVLRDMAGLAGIQLKHDERTDAEIVSAQHLSDRFSGRTAPDDVEKATLKKEVLQRYKDGNPAALEEAKVTGKLSAKEAENLATKASTPELEWNTRNLDYKSALAVYAKANLEEKAQLHDIIRDKIIKAKIPESQQDALLKENGITPPADLVLTREQASLNKKEQADQDRQKEIDSLRRQLAARAQAGDAQGASALRTKLQEVTDLPNQLTPRDKVRLKDLRDYVKARNDMQKRISEGSISPSQGQASIIALRSRISQR